MAIRTLRFAAVLLAASFGAGLLPAAAQQPPGERPPQPVTVIVAKAGPVELTDVLPGRVVAHQQAEIRPQVDGIIEKRLFEEGSTVTAGQPLYQIVADSYRAALNQARADVTRYQASVALAEKTLERYATLLRSRTASQQSYDDAVAGEAEARAALAAAEARVVAAEIDLEHTTITAPISGIIGRSAVSQGALVTARQVTPLATVTVLDPTYVDLTQSSTSLLDLRQKIASGAVSATTDVPVTLLLDSRGTEYPHKGTLQFSEVIVDSGTSSVTLRAVFANPDKVLLPGMFVRGELAQGRIANGILVPQAAVTRAPNGSPFVWIVDEGDVIARRVLTIERAVKNDWLVTTGIVDGDRVVVDAVMKVSDGAKVTVNPPADAAAPAEGAGGAPAAPAK